jgi:hypothetical protein
MMNYQKLMDRNPTSYGKMINDQGQEIDIVSANYENN